MTDERHRERDEDGDGREHSPGGEDCAGRADGSGRMIDRRRFLQVSGATAAAVGGGLASASAASARSRTAQKLAPTAGHGSRPELATPGSGQAVAIPTGLQTTPIRPPAAPLIVRSPYLSTWQASTVAPGTWQTFWNGSRRWAGSRGSTAPPTSSPATRRSASTCPTAATGSRRPSPTLRRRSRRRTCR